MIKLNGVKIEPTYFPDGTIQVWKLPEDLLKAVERSVSCDVEWDYQGDGELVELAQLKALLDAYTEHVALHIPFLPYGRQDKHVSNGSTFGLRVFARLLNSLNFSRVVTLDAHSHKAGEWIERLEDKSPQRFIEAALMETKADFVLCPDQGAGERYGAYSLGWAVVFASKKRDQSTGEILGVDLGDSASFKKKSVLIVDDICDGGRTFVEVAKAAHAAEAKDVHLYVTHGIFSRGLEPLREAGIKRIFTHKGEVKF